MFSHGEKKFACDNNIDNNNEVSRCNDNCGKLSFALRSSPVVAFESDSKQQFKLRRCRSQSKVKTVQSEIDNMGNTIIRSRSLDNVEIDSKVYESLMPKEREKEVVNDFDSSDDDYKLLESSDDEIDDCVTNTFEETTNDVDNGQTENRCGQNLDLNNDCIQQLSPSCANASRNSLEHDLLCQKYSTLPRVKFKKGNVNRDPFARCSVPYKSFSVNCTSSDEIKVVNESFASLTSEAPLRNDKSEIENSFRSTTLPKPRSRLSEPFSRRSLRLAIDFAMPAKHFRISDAPQHSAVIIPESTSGTDSANSKVKRTRSNLSWLRKSMRKLNPFQMPQISSENIEPQSVPIPSTSETIPNCNETCIDKNDEEHVFQNSSSNDEMLVSYPSNPDLFNIVLNEQQQNVDQDRPRQYGRRSNPVRISSFAIESSDNGAARIIAHHQTERRPASAPVPVERLHNTPNNNVHRSRACLPSEPSSLASSRNSSPVSLVSSTGSSSVADPITEAEVRPRFVTANRSDDDADGGESDTSKIQWPHSLSRPICCLFCTLGLFNISRFAIFSVHFGANFLVQFLILSFLFGIPMLWLQMVLGQKIKGGIVTMYRITPICKGIGVALMISHSIISLYSSVSIAWLLIYLRDSVISSDSHYEWQERFDNYRGYQNISALRLSENIADYFNGVVLQRLSGVSNSHDGKMRFQLAFSVSIVWTLVFILLCRGIRSLGQIMLGLAMFCFLGLSAVCIKFLTLLSFETVQDIFPATDWQEFFANSNSWSVAAQEAFLTWGLLGVSVYTMYCKTGKNQQLNKHVLRREALLIVFLTLFGLFLGAVLGSTCVILLKLNGFSYFPASFENPKNDISLWPAHHSIVPSFHHSIPSRWITRYSNIIGESFERPIFVNQQGILVYKESGYKPLRLVTEILPATLAISSRIQPVWGIIVLASLFFFGLGQLGVMWKPIAGAIGTSTSAILLSCVTGLFLGFPLTTDNGIVIIHFLDFIFGGAWWLLILWASFIISIFMVRGRPFTSDVLVKELKFTETLSAFLAFSWNVLVPIALILLSVMEYKKSYSNELFHQRNIPSLNHLANLPVWAKQLGGFLQLSLLILVPCVALMQIYIYLTKGPRDILERIELLFRPPMEDHNDPTISHLPIRRLCQQNINQSQPVIAPLSRTDNTLVVNNNDAPPKYSPPPSYSRAVGLRVAKALRNSIRRSVRRFRRNEEPRVESQQNVPTISSSLADPPSFSQSLRINSQTVNRNINEFIRSTIHGTDRNTQSVENLMLSDISINTSFENRDNQTSNVNNSFGNLV